MNLLIYSPQVDRDESELLQMTRHHDLHIVRTPEELISRLRQSPGDHGLSTVILLISEMPELEKLVDAREYLSSKALILVLPEDDSALISMGLRLRATYMGFRGGTLEDVAAVMARIQKRIARMQGINRLWFPERQNTEED